MRDLDEIRTRAAARDWPAAYYAQRCLDLLAELDRRDRREAEQQTRLRIYEDALEAIRDNDPQVVDWARGVQAAAPWMAARADAALVRAQALNATPPPQEPQEGQP